MTDVQQLASRLREVLLDGKWVANTNYRATLDGLDWEVAVREPDTGNSIALLARHIHYYLAGVRQVFEGGPLEIRDKYSFDFTPITSEGQWEDFLQQFWTDSHALVELISNMPHHQLDAPFVEEKYGDYRRNINAIIEHCYYHLGQIVLLKKQFSAK